MTDALAAIYRYRAIDDRLSTSGQPSVAQLDAIAQAGYTTIINLALHDDPRYALPDEAGTVRALGLTYVHIPVQFKNPTPADLAAFMAAMEAHRDAKLWIHCAANIRVSAFLGLYRVLRLGWARAPAFALMREIWTPDAVWSSYIDSCLAEQPT